MCISDRLTVVITVSYVLPGTAVTAWASEKEEAGEYPLLGYIDDITVLFDGKEAAPGDEFSDCLLYTSLHCLPC